MLRHATLLLALALLPLAAPASADETPAVAAAGPGQHRIEMDLPPLGPFSCGGDSVVTVAGRTAGPLRISTTGGTCGGNLMGFQEGECGVDEAGTLRCSTRDGFPMDLTLTAAGALWFHVDDDDFVETLTGRLVRAA